MKTTFKISFRAARKPSGKGTLVIRITRHREARVITTSYEVDSGEWDEALQKVVSLANSSPQRRKELSAINSKLKKDLQLILKTAESLETGGEYSSQDIVDRFRKQQHGPMFCQYIDSLVDALKKEELFGTARTYHSAAVSFSKFLEGKDISMNKISAELMKAYQSYLKARKNKDNTVSCYMRSLRAAFNHAIAEKVFVVTKKQACSPFSQVFTGNARTLKRAVDAENIRKINEMKLEEPSPDLSPGPSPQGEGSVSPPLWGGVGGEILSRDLFMFSFFTQGMNFSDMANLKKENIQGGQIRYCRKKTGQQITVELENCMKKIIDCYADPDSNLIFPILRKYQDCDAFTQWKKTTAALAVFNRNLNRLAKQAGIGSRLTSYVARHSWASIASQAGIPIATISKGMGHESEKTTRIYISQLDYSDVGRANKKILSQFTG